MTPSSAKFQETIYSYYQKNKRDLPWRRNTSPFSIFVSEVMLQQTQVGRVTEKYKLFLKTFPTFADLASSRTKDLLRAWQGLGYNRRALNLKKTAQIIIEKYKGKIPQSVEELDALPGIGPATAGSILVYAFNKPAPFIETNIRTVYIHFFFVGKQFVSDKELMPLVEKTIDKANPRKWFWALMDYGTFLKSQGLSHGARSAHYTIQSKFKGSNREVRGAILKILTSSGMSQSELLKRIKLNSDKIITNLEVLEKEEFITKVGKLYMVKD